jgi:hypothetical protein
LSLVFRQGHTNDEIFDLVNAEGKEHVDASMIRRVSRHSMNQNPV